MLKPVGGREGAMGEVSAAGRTAIRLDAALIRGSEEGTSLDEPPVWARQMELTVRVWTVRRTEAAATAYGVLGDRAHALGRNPRGAKLCEMPSRMANRG